jgi:hypothetical protein
MYSEFIININKISQYAETGDVNYGVSQMQTRNNRQTLSGKQFSSLQNVWNHNLWVKQR